MNKYCRVCGDKAFGFNYNALCCVSCKAFFRRNAFKQEKLLCKTGKIRCEISISNRKYCKLCRLEKCFQIGMKKDMILSIKTGQQNVQISTEINLMTNRAHLQNYEFELILQLNKAASSVFSDELNLQVCGRATSLVEAINLQTFYVKHIIKLCKNFEPFKCSSLNDQIQMLKCVFFGVIATRTVFHYNCERNLFTLIGNESCDKVLHVFCEPMNESMDADTHNFFREKFVAFNKLMENDPTIRNLLMAIIMFSAHQNVAYSEYIRYNYFMYSRLLWRYLECKYGNHHWTEKKYRSLMTQLTQIDVMKSRFEHVMAGVEPKSLLTDVLIEMYSLT